MGAFKKYSTRVTAAMPTRRAGGSSLTTAP